MAGGRSITFLKFIIYTISACFIFITANIHPRFGFSVVSLLQSHYYLLLIIPIGTT